MRNLSVTFGTTDPSAWLSVWCRDVHEVSDERAKRNVRSISGALSKVLQLRGVSYEWNSQDERLHGQARLGVIAQEVQQVVPQAVTVNERGAGVSYSALVPLLIESVKELKKENDTLRQDFAELKEQIAALREHPRSSPSGARKKS